MEKPTQPVCAEDYRITATEAEWIADWVDGWTYICAHYLAGTVTNHPFIFDAWHLPTRRQCKAGML